MFYAVTPINLIWLNPCNHHPSRRINCISQECSTSNFSMSNSQLSSLPLAQLYSLADDTTSSGCLVMRHLHVQEYPTRAGLITRSVSVAHPFDAEWLLP